MKKDKTITLIVSFTLILSTLAFALDNDIIKIQGVVMTIDLKKNMMIVNEKPFVWDQKTIICNEKGIPITMDNIKAKTWVYVEGVYDRHMNSFLAKKIYTIPKYIPEKERLLYPFIG